MDGRKALSEDWSQLLTMFTYHGFAPDLHVRAAELSDHVIQLDSRRQKSQPLSPFNSIKLHISHS